MHRSLVPHQAVAAWRACNPHGCKVCCLQKSTNNFTTSKFTTSGGGQEGWDLPGLALSGIQTWLKLRTRYQVSGRRHAGY